MINIRDLRIDPASLGAKKLLVDIVPVYEYKNNQRTDEVVAHRYIVALPELRLEKIGVKIDGKSIGAVKSYTFENVSRTHTIEVIFMKANGNPRTGVFVDVATGSYYEDAVDCAVLFSLQETN